MVQEHTLLAGTIDQAISDWGLGDQVTSEAISRHILDSTAFWSTILADGSILALVRLYSPVVQRQEVFLGNVLFNDFLFKALPRAVEQSGQGEAVSLLNDLENAYILWRGTGDLEALRDAYRDEVLAALPDLYFGDEDPARGIHGDMSKLFTFTKSDFEPFPVYSVPVFLSFGLERMVRRHIKRLLQSEDFERSFRTVMASLAFFYGQTSGGTGDAQSFATFLYRLATHYQVLPEDKIKVVFGLDEISKLAIKTAIDENRFEPQQLKNLLLDLEEWFADEIDKGNEDWLLGFIRKDEKLIQINEEGFLDEILGQVQIGFLTACNLYPESATLPICPLCGSRLPAVRESYVIVGINKSRFTTRSPKRKGSRQDSVICTRCALDVYTLARAVGTDDIVWQKQPRKTARMPRLYNVIFHYGHHDDWEVGVIQRQIDYVLAHAGGEKEIMELWTDLQQLREQVAQEHDASDLAEIDWEAWVPPAMEVVAQMQQDVRAEVIPLGMGDYRMLVFILPQLRPDSKEGLDFVQKRFSRSRLAVYTLLGLLRKLCGCDGPYYFQSLPTLAPGGFDPNTFYVSGQTEQADTALRHYGAITDFARRVVKYRKGHSILADWIMLADHLLEDPLGTFSEVVRASPKTKRDFSKDYRDKFKYRSLGSYGSIDDTGLGVVDSTEYLALYEMLQEMAKKGGDTMPKQVPIEQMDVFCDKLFRALDCAGLLPIHLGEAAHAFEKHTRLLVGLLRRYEQVEAALAEWETRALRGMHDSRRETAYPHFHALREWLTAPENRQLFEGDDRKDNLNHLKRSLYSRIYTWLYPRRKLSTAYTQAHIGNAPQFKPEAIARDFVDTTESVRQELSLATDGPAVADAQAFAIAKRGYYRKWKSGVETPDEEEEEEEAEL